MLSKLKEKGREGEGFEEPNKETLPEQIYWLEVDEGGEKVKSQKWGGGNEKIGDMAGKHVGGEADFAQKKGLHGN